MSDNQLTVVQSGATILDVVESSSTVQLDVLTPDVINLTIQTVPDANLGPVLTLISAAGDKTNLAFLEANAAFALANLANSSIKDYSPAFLAANLAFSKANTSSDSANAAFALAVQAYNTANNIDTIDVANSFGQANTSYNRANAAYGQANVAYNQANTSYNQANAAYGQANTSYNQANAAYGQANAAYGQANVAYNQANAAYGQANSGISNGILSFNQANAAYILANIAFQNAQNKINIPTVQIVTGDYSVNVSDSILLINSANNVNITLPNSYVTLGRSYDVKNINIGTVLLSGTGTDLIDGYANLSILYKNSMLGLKSIGTGWIVY